MCASRYIYIYIYNWNHIYVHMSIYVYLYTCILLYCSDCPKQTRSQTRLKPCALEFPFPGPTISLVTQPVKFTFKNAFFRK